MDCKPINSIMVRYRHPIPCVDDLLDELYGACVFPKLICEVGIIRLRSKSTQLRPEVSRPDEADSVSAC
ncbi:hypothetical protein CR513_50549, partial [Mucuna pruriens]